MCTLYVFWNDKKKTFIDQIAKDWQHNSDGGSAIMLDDQNNVVMRVQTTDLKILLNCIRTSKFARYCVHLRAATTDAQGVTGCHFFDSPKGKYIYAHNGVIHSGYEHRVDSMIVGEWLESADDRNKLPPELEYEGFANLIVYSMLTGEIIIHHAGGSLHSDGLGNWSTKYVDASFKSLRREGWYDDYGNVIQLHPEVFTPRYSKYFRADYDLNYNTRCDCCGEHKGSTMYYADAKSELCYSCRRSFYDVDDKKTVQVKLIADQRTEKNQDSSLLLPED
jgi:hypothetical protein